MGHQEADRRLRIESGERHRHHRMIGDLAASGDDHPQLRRGPMNLAQGVPDLVDVLVAAPLHLLERVEDEEHRPVADAQGVSSTRSRPPPGARPVRRSGRCSSRASRHGSGHRARGLGVLHGELLQGFDSSVSGSARRRRAGRSRGRRTGSGPVPSPRVLQDELARSVDLPTPPGPEITSGTISVCGRRGVALSLRVTLGASTPAYARSRASSAVRDPGSGRQPAARTGPSRVSQGDPAVSAPRRRVERRAAARSQPLTSQV